MGVFYDQTSKDELEIRRQPSEYVSSLPTMMQWTLWLAFTRPEHAAVLTHSQFSLVLYTCIACGAQFNEYPNADHTAMSKQAPKRVHKIRVGAKVRKEKIDHYLRMSDSMKVTEKEQIPVTVTKQGLGCPDCVALYAEKESEAAGVNITREQINTIQAHMAQLKGCANSGCGKPYNECKCKKFKPHTFRAMGLVQPYLTVLETPECKVCKDTLHRWDATKWNTERKALGAYVRCRCSPERLS
jgi:hypothetical protein